MENLTIQLVIIVAVYALQQFLVGKKKNKGPYHYPDEEIIYDSGQIQQPETVGYEEIHYEGKYRMENLPTGQMKAQQEQNNKIAIVEKVPNAWNGKLGNKHMVHGFVMAELFAPPRSLNPYKIKKY